MRPLPCRIILLAFSVFVGLAARSNAGEGCCLHCGCTSNCQRTCRLVCEEKKVEVVCWGCKCEDFCVPGPSEPGCEHCEEVCGSCEDAKGVCVQPKKFVWTEWIPGGARVLTKKKLMKKVVTKKVPSYKWVVEDLCPNCQANCKQVEVPAGTEVPPAPPSSASATGVRTAQ